MTGTERKVLNKYYPPDFDPRKLPKVHMPRNRQYVIRVMAPFNMKCHTCGEYIYKGKKFNARRETVEDDDYLGLAIFRFYIRCPRCLAEITFKTDLRNCDYAEEHGATRLFEAEKLLQEKERIEQEKEEEEKSNPMKMLEKRTKMSRFEMDALERLEELKELNQRQGKVNFDQIITQVRKDIIEEEIKQEREDEEFVRSIFHPGEDVKKVKRIENDGDDDADALPNLLQPEPAGLSSSTALKNKISKQRQLIGSMIKRKKCGTDPDLNDESDRQPPPSSSSLDVSGNSSSSAASPDVCSRLQEAHCITTRQGEPSMSGGASAFGLNLLSAYDSSCSSGEESG